MFCSKCGAQLADGAKFCASCGSPVEGAPAAVSEVEGAPSEPVPAAAAVPDTAAATADTAAADTARATQPVEPAIGATEVMPTVQQSAQAAVPYQAAQQQAAGAQQTATSQQAASQQAPQAAGGLSSGARIGIIAAIVVVVAIIAGAIGCNAGRVSGGDSGTSSDSGSSISASSPSSASSSSGASISSSTSSTSSTSSSSGSSASSSGSATAGMPSPSGKLVEYKAQNGGFGITVDDTFIVKDTSSEFCVYTAKEGLLPWYSVSSSRTVSAGTTMQERLDNMAEIIKENYAGRLVVEPITNSVTLSDGRTVQGIEFIYESSGGAQLAEFRYLDDQVNGFTYTWTGICDPDDSITPYAMEVAMGSFHFLAS